MTDKKEIVKKDGNALIIIDGNGDFCEHGGGLFVAGVKGEADTDQIILNIRMLAKKPFDHLVTTEDMHPDDHIEAKIFGPHCIVGTPGQKYHHDLLEIYENADEQIIKGQNPTIISYSVSTSSQFHEHITRLRMKGIKRVFVVGWAFTHCVGESAIAYAAQGFETYVVRDATASVTPPYGDPMAMTKKLALYGVNLVNYQDIK